MFIPLKTDNLKQANIAVGEIEKRIWSLSQGLVEPPPEGDLTEWLRSGGVSKRPSARRCLRELVEAYRSSITEGSKAETTRTGEEIHFRHLTRILGETTTLNRIDADRFSEYVSTRQEENFRGRPVSGATIRKEIVSFRMLWKFARKRGWVANDDPSRSISLPKSKANDERYRTFGEIMSLLPTVAPERHGEIWKTCVLDSKEVEAFLADMQKAKVPDWFKKAIVLAALTGVRRSELFRIRTDDFDFQSGLLTVREKKRRHGSSESRRYVQLAASVSEFLRPLLAAREPGFVFSDDAAEMTTKRQSYWLWKCALKDTQWQSITGFHTLRHSFISNAAASGITEAQLWSWTGHLTEEQKTRYRHFFPSQSRKEIELLKISVPVAHPSSSGDESPNPE